MSDDKIIKFIHLRGIDGKSLESISSTLSEPLEKLEEWEKKHKAKIIETKARAYDSILETGGISSISRFKYLVSLYQKMEKELNKRDFSGLPTDKLFYIMDDLYNIILDHQNTSEEE